MDGSYSGYSNNFTNDEMQHSIGYYGLDGTQNDIPDIVNITDGNNVTDIDLTLRSVYVSNLLSTTPENGETNVPTRGAGLSLTFNLPVIWRLSGYDDYSGDFMPKPFKLEMAPDPYYEQALIPIYSDFGRTFTLNGALAENTYYSVLVSSETNRYGANWFDLFSKTIGPTVFGFTTGEALPATSISGSVKLPEKDVEFAVVRLLSRDPNIRYMTGTTDPDNTGMGSMNPDGSMMNGNPGRGMTDNIGPDSFRYAGPATQGFGLVDPESGQYSILAPNGTYWLFTAARIHNGMSSFENYSYYDPDGDGFADSVVVKDENISAIDMMFATPEIISFLGSVTGPGNRPVYNAQIKIYSANWKTEITADDHGRFNFKNVPDGEYTMEVYPPEGTNLMPKKFLTTIKYNSTVNMNIILSSSETHYEVDSTLSSYPIVIDNLIYKTNVLKWIDEIAVKLETGQIVGAVSLKNSFPITLYARADDPMTRAKDGFAPGDSIYFEAYNAWFDREIPAHADYREGDGMFGTGERSIVKLNIHVPAEGEKIDMRVHNPAVPVRTVFEDNSMLEVRFKSGRVAGAKVSMKNIGKHMPDDIPANNFLSNIAGYFQIEASVKEAFTATISFGYTDSMLISANIREDDLTIVYYDSARARWQVVTTEIDKENKIASAFTTHFSLWALTDKTLDIISGIEEEQGAADIPDMFTLKQNYPNPFNNETVFRFELPYLSDVRFVIYNLLGQEIKTLLNSNIPAGTHFAKWNGLNNNGVPVSSGVYLYQLRTENNIQTKKLLLLK